MEQDEKHIIGNLFEHWAYVGERAGLLTTAPSYKAVMPAESDWPRRVFDVQQPEALAHIATQIREGLLPDAVTFTASVAEALAAPLAAAGFQPKMSLQGMIIYLRENPPGESPEHIRFALAGSEADAYTFATIAEGSFNYRVDGAVVARLLGQENKIKVFIGTVDGRAACCGLIFYDEAGNAGLHFIGTLPDFRGKGLAAAMTTRLLQECVADGKRYCVLHASKAGLPIYTRLGFEPVKEVITYAHTL
ncbi:GNAT family N-acetyltransferase [Chitinophaga oryzae]|uniref:GNAT family N-acetyltransferase n=1 Tax=Chitinophaga oryzae TaxID=2725414 RepID=A0AAE7D809_9BACT|nr:GNAT family N-acetyltransferase [Chitinophaga oryzae]QJB31578.1 GNAT family N-acetyltransferase [Chitinophaga oryzae]